MFGPKFYAVSGAVGFGLSFLVGVICGAALPLVLLRAVVFGIVFAAIAFGGVFVLRRFLPEFFEAVSPSPGEGSSAVGSGVDVTVGGQDEEFPLSVDTPPSTGKPEVAPAPSGGEGEPAGMNAVPEFSEDDFEPEPDPAVVPDDVMAGAVDVPVPPQNSPGANQQENPADAAFSGVSPSASESAAPASEDGLDVLPDVSSFVSVAGEDGESAAFQGFGGDVSIGAAGGGSVASAAKDFSAFADNPGVEAETMAKAIRTVLSKE